MIEFYTKKQKLAKNSELTERDASTEGQTEKCTKRQTYTKKRHMGRQTKQT